MSRPSSMPAVAALLAGMVRRIEEDTGEEVAEGAGPVDAALLVDASLWMAQHLLWLAVADGPDAGRSQRWVASAERLALQVDGLRTGGAA